MPLRSRATRLGLVALLALPFRSLCSLCTAPSPPFCALSVRGGARKNRRSSGGKTATLHATSGREKKSKLAKKHEKKSAAADLYSRYRGVLPATRIYMGGLMLATLLGLLGENVQGLMALDPLRTLNGLELWRPLSAALYMGPPSVGLLMNGYYLYQYGSTLESAYGTAQLTVFFLTQVSLLSVLAVAFGLPFFGQSVLTAMLHVLSRQTPKDDVKWLIFNVPYWTLPLGLMLTDVLQAQSPSASVPHVLGMLTGESCGGGGGAARPTVR